MKKEKIVYRYFRYTGKMIKAKKEVSFETRLTARMILDEVCFNWNKEQLSAAIDESIKEGNKQEFMKLSEAYKDYVWEH
ncbi:IDEAL domain-containing protein [Virgibacillus ainsalahensis]